MRERLKRRGKIRNQLVLGIVGVVVLSGLVTYAVAMASFREEFDILVERNDLQTAASFAAELAEFYQARGSWSGVEAEIESLRQTPAMSRAEREDRFAEGYGGYKDYGYRGRDEHAKAFDIPLVVTDASGSPIYAGMRAHGGKDDYALPQRLDVAKGAKVVVDGETVAYAFFKSMIFRSYDPQESAYIASLTKWIILSVLIGTILALALGTFLASRFARPVAALDSAVRTIALGDMSARVDVRRNDEIGSLAGNFNLMADRLQTTEAARQGLLADIAHELRTPVSIIQANLEMMLDGVYEAEEAKLRSLYEETRILTDLIADLRSLSDLEVGASPARGERIDVSELAEKSCAKLGPLFEERGISLRCPGRDDGLVALGQEDKVQQVFRNALGNALKYAPEGSTVTLSLERIPPSEGRGPAIRATVEDEGSGVPEDKTERIFERFYRVDPSRSRSSGGRGLGLAICKAIVESFGGRIGARNREPHGLALWFELPAASSEPRG